MSISSALALCVSHLHNEPHFAVQLLLSQEQGAYSQPSLTAAVVFFVVAANKRNENNPMTEPENRD